MGLLGSKTGRYLNGGTGQACDQPAVPENHTSASNRILRACRVDPYEIEAGNRTISIPEGTAGLLDGAFSEYNGGDIVSSVRQMLYTPILHANQVERELMRTPNRALPPDIKRLRSLKERRDYVLQEDMNRRLLTVCLPATMENLEAGSFPRYLEEIRVNDENPWYSSRDGVLFSKDGTALVRYPGLRADKVYHIPAETTELREGAFSDSFLDELVIPGTFREIPAHVFEGGRYHTLRIGEGVQVLKAGCFRNCTICHLELPSTLCYIEDECFAGLSGLKEIMCHSDQVRLGNRLFCGGTFHDVTWWNWQEVSPGAFLNAKLKKITIPEGVETIRRYAFAGCFQAQEITIPQTVREIEPEAFDEGYAFHANVVLPEHLYRYLFRFPACSTINRRAKPSILRQYPYWDIGEERSVLEKQKADTEQIQKKYHILQILQRRRAGAQLRILGELLCASPAK